MSAKSARSRASVRRARAQSRRARELARVRAGQQAARASGKTSTKTGYTVRRLANPARSSVHDSSGRWIATFTDGSYTVTLDAAARTFSEASAAAPVNSRVAVRTLARPFAGTVDWNWLKAARSDTRPDVLALAMQYIAGAPNGFDGGGLRISGDASYGPLLADGTREEGSDFNDYLGVSWTYGTTTDAPEERQIASLDCSGFLRMVFGYRAGVPLSLESTGTTLPRRAVQMLGSAPGVVTISDTGTQVTSFSALAPGDLVFFDAATDDGTQIDHVGMYLGQDTAGNARFISSRKTPDGPTLGDTGARSILNGTGYYASAFRAVRRL